MSVVVFALIPAYQEERFIREVVARALPAVDRVVVIDDGSTDRTAEEARAAGATLVSHAKNQGKGAAIKSGFRYALEQNATQVVLLDGDGQHRPEEIPLFIEEARRGSMLIVGNRMNDTARMPFVRRVVNRTMSGMISGACGQRIPDSQCGFRLVHRDIIPSILSETNAFDYETEMLLIAAGLGCKIGNVPVTTIYGEEKSKIRPIPDTIAFFKLMARHWLGLSRK